jgi:hypothetical protein
MIILDNKKFEPFVKRSKELPSISSLKIHSKIEQFLYGVVPELTPDEREAIENYLPHEIWSKFNQLTDEVINEIKWNLVNIPSEDQKKDYLEYLKGVLSPITYSLKSATWFDEIDKMDPDFAAKFELEQTQIRSFRLLYDLLWRSNRYYYIMYDKVETFVQGLLPASYKKKTLTAHFEALKKINEQKSSDGTISLSDHSGHISKTLKSLFKNAKAYDQLIEFMSVERLISKGEKGIIWKGLKANRKFEIVAFYEVLFLNGFFTSDDRISDKELRIIANNTFFGLNVSYKTIGNKAYNNLTANYNEILVRFSHFHNKASQPSIQPS